MKSITLRTTIFAVAIFAPLAIVAASADSPLVLQSTSRIWVSGTSNVKNFECKAVSPVVNADATKSDAATAIVAGEKSVVAVDLKVAVETLDCGSGTMNGHMKDAMDPKDHPTIEFALASYDLAKSVDSAGVTLAGTLTIHGEAKPVTINAGAKNAGGGVLHLTGMYELNMKDYGVKPPSLMLGTMRVGEKVQVHFDLQLKN